MWFTFLPADAGGGTAPNASAGEASMPIQAENDLCRYGGCGQRPATARAVLQAYRKVKPVVRA